MGLYLGISCLRSDWYGAAIDTGTRPATRSAETCEPDCYLEGYESFFAYLESFGHLSQSCLAGNSGGTSPRSEEWVVKTAFEKLQLTDLGNQYYEFCARRLQQTPDLVGVCHPYGLSSTIRRALPALVDRREPVRSRLRTGRDSPHLDLQADGEAPRLCALETPLAIALELMATDRMRAPSRTVVVSPGSIGHEVTVLEVPPTVGSLSLLVARFEEVCDFDRSADSLTKLIGTRSLGDNSDIHVVHVGQTTADLANRIVAANGKATLYEVSEAEAASGVARYASLCHEGRIDVGGSRISELNCRLIAPHAIGICGRGGTDDTKGLFWCPLVEAGTPLSGPSAYLRLDKLPVDDLILADCTSRKRLPGQWIRWEGEPPRYFRWHSQVSVPEMRGGAVPDQLELTIDSSAGCLKYGWSDSFVRVALRP